MARIVLIHIRYPEFDRSSGDLRLCNFLKLLAESNDITLHILHKDSDYIQAADCEKYRTALMNAGVRVTHGSLARELRSAVFDLAIIEYWFVAQPVIEQIRLLQPNATIVVDSEHIYFYSDQFKARALGQDIDSLKSRDRKAAEISTYHAADAVITVTREDRDVLLAELPETNVFVVPNIHEIPDVDPDADSKRVPGRLIFVGNFASNAQNVDSVLWFVEEIFPIVLKAVPRAHLQIVGNSPPDSVTKLASPSIEITGYVPDTAPYLLSSQISICPLRFGAGLKGKIGEAMMYRLPVVTTDIGAQGMDLRHGEGIMIANSPEEFANSIIELLGDPALRHRISENGFEYLQKQYSIDAGRQYVTDFSTAVKRLKSKRLPKIKRYLLRSRQLFSDHIGWRFN